MFLNEVALGAEHHITRDDSSLKAGPLSFPLFPHLIFSYLFFLASFNLKSHFCSAPKGFQSVIAQGRTEPDHSKAEKVKYDGKEAVMAMGKPLERPEFAYPQFTLLSWN